MSGTNSSQTPELPSWRIGCSRPSQLLNEPFTRIPRADGAHTANEVPVTASSERPLVAVDPRPEDLPEVLVAALVDEVEVDLAQGRQEPVGIVDRERRVVAVG